MQHTQRQVSIVSRSVISSVHQIAARAAPAPDGPVLACAASMSSESQTDARAGAPEWVDALVQEALRRDAEGEGRSAEGARVASLALSIATAPGDNYISVIYRAKVTLAGGEKLSLLVKVPPKEGAMTKAAVEGGLFKIESIMIASVIPKMEAHLERVASGRFLPFAARCLLHGSSPAPFLVLEDLKPQGFLLADRHRGLGLRHSLIAIRTLARFHAASAALLAEDPNVREQLRNMDSNGFDNFVTSCIQLAANACRGWHGYEEYADILEKYKKIAVKNMVELHTPAQGAFNVVTHGDYWTNNLMFKYSGDGKPCDMRSVDFQASHVASPTLDILYFLNTCLSDEVSERHEAMLVREYHNELTSTLQLLNMRSPSFKELLADLDKHGIFAVFTSTCVLPIVRSQKRVNVAQILTGNANDNAFVFDNPSMKRWLQRMLPEYKRRGWLNICN